MLPSPQYPSMDRLNPGLVEPIKPWQRNQHAHRHQEILGSGGCGASSKPPYSILQGTFSVLNFSFCYKDLNSLTLLVLGPMFLSISLLWDDDCQSDFWEGHLCPHALSPLPLRCGLHSAKENASTPSTRPSLTMAYRTSGALWQILCTSCKQ